MRRALRNVALAVGVVTIGVWVLLPFYFLVAASFARTGAQISGLWIGQFSLEHYEWVLTGPNPLLAPLRNSLVIVSCTTLLVLALALPAGYGLSRWRTGVGRVIYTGFFSLRMLPPLTLAIPLFIGFARLGLLDTWTAVILALAALNCPAAVWLLAGFFGTVPRELEEAAWLDGANAWQTFARIVSPSIAGPIAANALYVGLNAYIAYVIPVTLSRNRAVPLPVYIASLQSDFRFLTEEMLAASLIGAVPMIGLYLLFTRSSLRTW